eukprot:TRINITY_DN4597_c0_g1_i4.p1 TRINITY_DN4597_c0_g1~~TRINITY_DN4597_c0_g1_i4.p1  ORF type:complete len:625 (+),score=140.00 TRINITY_DN4597_c0_g1_i4:58-1875(+)
MTSTYNHRNPAVKRILSEVREMLKENSWQYTAAPLDNLFEWHFTIRGPPDSAFEEGIYHGRHKPPPSLSSPPMTSTYNHRNPAVKRILSEVREMLKENSWQYTAAPLDNLFEWHFTIRGPPDSAFEEGIYHGRIILPPEYPMKPPDFMFLTPNGRFKENEKFCVTISGYHPEKWQAAWTVRTALLALISLMPDAVEGIGSVDYGEDERRRLAKESVNFECDVCGICVRDALPPIPQNVLESKEEQERRELLEKIEKEKEEEGEHQGVEAAGDSTANLEGFVDNGDNEEDEAAQSSRMQTLEHLGLRTQRMDSVDSTTSMNSDGTTDNTQTMQSSPAMMMPPMSMPPFQSPISQFNTSFNTSLNSTLSTGSASSLEELHANISNLSNQVNQSFNTLLVQQAQLQQVMNQVQSITMMNLASQSNNSSSSISIDTPMPTLTTSPAPSSTHTSTLRHRHVSSTDTNDHVQQTGQLENDMRESSGGATTTTTTTSTTSTSTSSPQRQERTEEQVVDEPQSPEVSQQETQYSTPVQEMNRRILERHGASEQSTSDTTQENGTTRNERESLRRQQVVASAQNQKRGFSLIIWGLLFSILLLLVRKFQILNEI